MGSGVFPNALLSDSSSVCVKDIESISRSVMTKRVRQFAKAISNVSKRNARINVLSKKHKINARARVNALFKKQIVILPRSSVTKRTKELNVTYIASKKKKSKKEIQERNSKNKSKNDENMTANKCERKSFQSN